MHSAGTRLLALTIALLLYFGTLAALRFYSEANFMVVASVLVTLISSWGIIAYEGYANERLWPVGVMLTGTITYLQLLAWIAGLGAIALSIFYLEWWHSIIIVIVSNLIIRLLFVAIGPIIQIAMVVAIHVGAIACTLLALQ